MGYAIVVDASVARSAGESQNPQARECRRVLDAISDYGHDLAMSGPLQQEWFKSRSAHGEPYASYASVYALRWFVDMRVKRRVVWIEIEGTVQLRQDILKAIPQDSRKQVRKDLHLVETALAADRRVLALDEKIRKHFRRAGQIVQQLCTILWLNPVHDPASHWLEQGAPDQKEYHLCQIQSNPKE